MAGEPIFQMYKLSKVYPPDREVLKEISLSFLPGAKIGVLGYNGAGKSSLLAIMAGRDSEFRGDAQLAPAASVGMLEQEPALDETKTVRENVLEGVGHLAGLLERFNELAANYSDENADEFARLQDEIAAADAWNLDVDDRAGDGRAALPARGRGDRRRSRAASAAVSRSAGCCSASPTCCCSTSRPTTSTPSRSSGSSTTSPTTRAPSSPSPTTATSSTTSPAGSSSSTAGAASPTAATTPAGSSRSRSASPRATSRRSRASGRSPPSSSGCAPTRRAAATSPRRAWPTTSGCWRRSPDVKLDQVQIHIPAGPRLGDLVIEATDLRKGFGDRLLIEDLSFSLPRGGIVGVIGPNGAGKTTLFRMITGQEQADGGTLRIGDTVELAYVDQSRDALDDSKNVWEEISGGLDQIKVGEQWVNSRQYTASFNFRGSDQQKQVSKLSGGERNRLHLAKLLKGGGNLLLLDEPTNDLDVDTLRALEEALLSFAGCAVVISHDRWFLDRIATHVLAFEGDSQVTWFEGNFEAYEEHRRALLGAEADRPKRISYKRLVR